MPNTSDAQHDSRTQGRWAHQEHEKFILGNHIYNHRKALSMYKRDWKKVETFIGTRSGAQIRSHAQKFFTRIEKEYPDVDIDIFIDNKAKVIQERKALLGDNPLNGQDISDNDDDTSNPNQKEESKGSDKK